MLTSSGIISISFNCCDSITNFLNSLWNNSNWSISICNLLELNLFTLIVLVSINLFKVEIALGVFNNLPNWSSSDLRG